jgi:transaldolase
VSRIDVYTEKNCPDLLPAAQGEVGIVNAKRIWELNEEFWGDKECALDQEIIFASTGTKKPEDPAWKYVSALAGSDIQTNPPATNQAVADNDSLEFSRQVDVFPSEELLNSIDANVDFKHMHETLMREGIAKFAQPQKELIALVGEKRASLAGA